VDEGLVETRRVSACSSKPAPAVCCCKANAEILAEEWPRVSATIERLGLKPEELLDGAAKRRKSTAKRRNTEP